jgi:hypothetical protein
MLARQIGAGTHGGLSLPCGALDVTSWSKLYDQKHQEIREHPLYFSPSFGVRTPEETPCQGVILIHILPEIQSSWIHLN